MEKPKSIIGKFFLILVGAFVVMSLGGGLSSSTSASSHGLDSRLATENLRLKNEYAKLTVKLAEMERQIEEIREYDNVIYSQILGVDYDTTDFYQYQNDSAKIAFDMFDSIFSEVNDRTYYAAEMLATQLVKLQETSKLFKSNKNAILYYPTISPIKTKEFICLSSPYGWRNHPVEKQILFHEGIDISAYPGTPVYSTAQGKVVKILYSKYGYGNRIVIQHAYGFETLYAHLDIIKVKRGQWVGKNQVIGTVGSTGTSTGPHLHYEIHKNNEPRDPLGYFYTEFTQELLAMNEI